MNVDYGLTLLRSSVLSLMICNSTLTPSFSVCLFLQDKDTKVGTCGYCGLQFKQKHHHWNISSVFASLYKLPYWLINCIMSVCLRAHSPYWSQFKLMSQHIYDYIVVCVHSESTIKGMWSNLLFILSRVLFVTHFMSLFYGISSVVV